MFRRRRSSDTDLVVFDLDADGEPSPPVLSRDEPPFAGDGDHGLLEGGGRPGGAESGGGGSDGDGAASDGTSPGRRRSRTQSRRQLIAAGSVLVVGLSAWGLTSAVHEHTRVQRLIAAGGVRSLAEPPETLWEAATDSADQPILMPGLVVVRRGTALHALDAATGDERWQAEVGGDPTCSSPLLAGPVDPVVCWSGDTAEHPSVTVVQRDGTAVTRELEPGLAAVAPGPDGTLVTVRRVGPPVAMPDIRVEAEDNGSWSYSGELPEHGQDAALRLEDAATGDERWERTIPYRATDELWNCVMFVGSADGSDPQPIIQTSALGVVAYRSVVDVTGCGLDGTFGIDGSAEDDTTWVSLAPDGRSAQHVSSVGRTGMATVLRAADGHELARVDDELHLPTATDGSADDVLLVGGYGSPLRRVTPDGETVWTADHSTSAVHVEANGVVVAQQIGGSVWAVDAETGQTLWTGASPGTDGWPGANDWVQAAFTDGTTALLAYVPTVDTGNSLQAAGDGRLTLIAFDVRTGEMRWEQTRPGGPSQLYALGGRLVEVVGSGGSVISDGPDGTPVRRASGTVRVLG